jgi:hypothetical protein
MTGTEISVKGAPTPVDALRDPKWTERQVTIRPPQEIRATVWDRIPLAKRRLLLEGPLSSGHAGLQSAVITLASEFGPREARRARVPDDDGTRTGSPATRCARSTPPGKRRG